MIQILVVDDNPQKVKDIKTTLLQIPNINEHSIDVAADKNNARKLLFNKQFDLLILDLSLPERFGDCPESEGGAKLLEEINIDPDVILPFHVIGLTAYPELRDKFSSQFNNYLWHLINYDIQYDNWKEQLSNSIHYLIKSKREIETPSNVKYDYDLAVVTVLNDSELKFLRDLPANWHAQKFANDVTYYHEGTFTKGKKNLRVVAASSNNTMGMAAAATLSMKLISRYRPRYLAMVGICAGIKGNIGDPIIADKIWDYGCGKHETYEKDGKKNDIFRPYVNQLPLDSELNSKFINIHDNNLYTREIYDRFPIKKYQIPTLQIGPFASGAAVIANKDIVETIKEQHSKLVGFDMESYAVFHAAMLCSSPRPTPFIIKSISDFGDSNKNNPNKDNDQAYAAYTSANLLYNFALDFLDER